jgi:hypothetical protein
LPLDRSWLRANNSLTCVVLLLLLQLLDDVTQLVQLGVVVLLQQTCLTQQKVVMEVLKGSGGVTLHLHACCTPDKMLTPGKHYVLERQELISSIEVLVQQSIEQTSFSKRP